MSEYIRLKETFCIRKWEDVYILIDSESGEHFELEEKQVDVLLKCDGTLVRQEIVKLFDYSGAGEFIDNLLEEDVLASSPSPHKREEPIVRSETTRLPLTDALLEFTGVCNLECEHCYNARFNTSYWVKQQLSLESWKTIINQMDHLGIRRIQLSGGEPFTSEFWDEITAYTKSKRIFIDAIASNATLINGDIAQRLKELMGNYGAVYVSLDGITAKQHDLLRGTGAFERTIRGIRILEKYAVNVVINTMFIQPNKDSMLQFHQFILNEFSNVKGWRIGCPKILGRYVGNWRSLYVPFSEAVNIFVEILEHYFKDDATYRLEMSDFFRTEVLHYGWETYSLSEHPCSYAVNNCTIKPNGDVVFCSSLEGYEGAYLGNVKEKPLVDIWYSGTHMKFQSLSIKEIPECASCKFVRLCGGGCRSNAWLTYKDIYRPDPRACLAMRTIDERVIPLLPKPLQEEWKRLVISDGQEPKWDALGDVL